jgi:hypothetical protein
MGKGSPRVAANRSSEDNEPGSPEAHYVGSSPQEDSSVPKSKMGEGYYLSQV